MKLDLSCEAKKRPASMAANFGGHPQIALLPWGVVAIGLDMWTASWVVALLYLVVWGGIQIRTEGRASRVTICNIVLDAGGVTLCLYGAACLGNGLQVESALFWAAGTTLTATGWRVQN